jgi:lipid A 3-O-deacylase
MSRAHASRVCWTFALFLVVSSGLSPAKAGSIVDEVKLGVLAHDVGFLVDAKEHGADIMGEVLFTSPDFLSIIGAPRPVLGLSGNSSGGTDYAYADLNWTGFFWHPEEGPEGAGVYVSGILGGAVHNGPLNTPTRDKEALGTRALFHLGAALGYQMTARNSVEIYFDHLSNADASSHNPGLNNVGVRVGFKF